MNVALGKYRSCTTKCIDHTPRVFTMRRVTNVPLRLSVEFLATCQSGLAVWLGPSAFRRLAILGGISKLPARIDNAQYTPLVCFLSLLRFLRKLSWLNGLAESFCGEAWLSAVNRC